MDEKSDKIWYFSKFWKSKKLDKILWFLELDLELDFDSKTMFLELDFGARFVIQKRYFLELDFWNFSSSKKSKIFMIFLDLKKCQK